jgi:hypothetical protein
MRITIVKLDNNWSKEKSHAGEMKIVEDKANRLELFVRSDVTSNGAEIWERLGACNAIAAGQILSLLHHTTKE